MVNWKRRRFLATLPLLLSPPHAAAVRQQQKNYRIDVVIQAWGIPVFARRGVGQGGGRLHWERQGAQERLRFEFGAASIPARAHGLRQIGYFEETLEEYQGNLVASDYFGFLTAAPGAAPQREALERQVADQARPQYCCAVEGRVEGGKGWFSKSYEAPLPPDAGLGMLGRLKATMRQTLAEICQTACLGGELAGASKTFLGALRAAAYAPTARQTIAYHYGDRRLRLDSQRRGTSEGVLVEATVSGKNRHCFRYLLPASTLPELPDRIEYQPKAWLKLTLVSLATTEESA